MLKTLAIPTVLLCTSCGVSIKDERFYVDLGPSGAVTVNFLTPGSMIILKPQWDQAREGMFCMTPAAMADIKREIEQLCSMTQCDYQTAQGLRDFYQRVNFAKGNL